MMQAGMYARVSSKRQAQEQTIEQQLASGRAAIEAHGWELSAAHIYRDDGYSGEVEVVVITAPDRRARKYLQQVLLVEEFERHGVRVEFVERPMSTDPHDQLLLQIRGAVAEYERTLITERVRRGKLAKLRAGQLLPWTRGHYGYQVDPARPRDPVGVRRDDAEAVVVEHRFAAYLEESATLYSVGKSRERRGVLTPRGRPYWSGCSVRAILRAPPYTGLAYGNQYHCVPAKGRVSPLLPIGPGHSHVLRAREEWVPIPVPAIVAEVCVPARARETRPQPATSCSHYPAGVSAAWPRELRPVSPDRRGSYHARRLWLLGVSRTHGSPAHQPRPAMHHALCARPAPRRSRLEGPLCRAE
jgi:site-specific DNA recombinase